MLRADYLVAATVPPADIVLCVKQEMRAAGNHQVVSDEVLQKQRLVVLGL